MLMTNRVMSSACSASPINAFTSANRLSTIHVISVPVSTALLNYSVNDYTDGGSSIIGDTEEIPPRCCLIVIRQQ